jgi:hypothetical protein
MLRRHWGNHTLNDEDVTNVAFPQARKGNAPGQGAVPGDARSLSKAHFNPMAFWGADSRDPRQIPAWK